MNIIFLDVDGVILPWDAEDPLSAYNNKNFAETILPIHPLELFNKLAAENNAKIVVASMWRFHDKDLMSHIHKSDKNYVPFDLRKFLTNSGLTAEFHEDWHTPMPDKLGELINGVPRGLEIFRWLKEHPDVDNWVSVDDDSSGFANLGIRQHLAKINPYKGFTDKDYETANKILKGI